DLLVEKETHIDAVSAFGRKRAIDYAIIGPEAPLEAGIVDRLEADGIPCMGPTRAAARLETDKGFCRDLMHRHHIPGCPDYRVFSAVDEAVDFITNYQGDVVVKPIGLTGGKGVRIMGEQVDREGAIGYARSLQGVAVIEERLLGEEFTLQAFVDGKSLVPMPLVQDHKRAFEGDTGPNTGGMGSYTMPDHRMPFVTQADFDRAFDIMKATVAAMAKEGHPYKGILYGQFMNTAAGPKVIEYNARFGDPEAMNVLSLISSDLGEIACGIADGSLSAGKVSFEKKATVCKYLVPEGYPDAPVSGQPLTIGDHEGALVYYANVEENDGRLVTLTSRTLAFVGMGDTLQEAEQHAEKAAASVTGKVRYRRDIGTQQLLDLRIAHMKELR
ncbi:MAG: phosphoribosylamine--glycine ligase, partial [Methanomicrobiales archaeon]|nr:phosphoribosylamine--glycine ligase [Methanomicrobiales archaeon]